MLAMLLEEEEDDARLHDFDLDALMPDSIEGDLEGLQE